MEEGERGQDGQADDDLHLLAVVQVLPPLPVERLQTELESSRVEARSLDLTDEDQDCDYVLLRSDARLKLGIDLHAPVPATSPISRLRAIALAPLPPPPPPPPPPPAAAVLAIAFERDRVFPVEDDLIQRGGVRPYDCQGGPADAFLRALCDHNGTCTDARTIDSVLRITFTSRVHIMPSCELQPFLIDRKRPFHLVRTLDDVFGCLDNHAVVKTRVLNEIESQSIRGYVTCSDLLWLTALLLTADSKGWCVVLESFTAGDDSSSYLTVFVKEDCVHAGQRCHSYTCAQRADRELIDGRRGLCCCRTGHRGDPSDHHQA